MNGERLAIGLVARGVFFPATMFIWPIAETSASVFGLTCWWLLTVALVTYPISTFVGRLEPVG